MQVITETELVGKIRAFLDRHQMAPTTFGREATGEPQLIQSIEGGRSPSLKVVQRIAAFMAAKDRELVTAHPASPPEPAGEGEPDLPFAKAPVNPTGASSPTSSSTSAPQASPKANGSCPSCCGADAASSAHEVSK